MIHAIWRINNGYSKNNNSPKRYPPLNYLAIRYLLPFALFPFSSGVSAIGLGELHGQPALGERLRLEVILLGAEKQFPDPACFRLVQPVNVGDLPWLKQAVISVRKSTPPVLEIRSELPLREPILQLAVQMTCGVEVSREYMLLASPRIDADPPLAESPSVREANAALPLPASRRGSPRALAERAEPAPVLKPRRIAKRPVAAPLPDRVLLASGGDVGEPSLRLATSIFSSGDVAANAAEAQREILRLEFHMLMLLNEQVSTQMATAEKLRNMEGTLGELQERTTEFAQRVGSSDSPAASSPAENFDKPIAQRIAAAPSIKPPPVPLREVEMSSSGLSEWSLYGVLLGALLGVGGWLGWRNYRERKHADIEVLDFDDASSDLAVDAKRSDEHEELGGVDLHVEPSVMGAIMEVDLPLDGGLNQVEDIRTPDVSPPLASDTLNSIGAVTVDEYLEANPVMELADIMLSFGRVKGAAQALQEYIDSNPQEALQPWIRLMDVYRMADMRAEFETVAENLNKNFNVEVQQWDAAESLSGEVAVDLLLDDPDASALALRPESLEDMPRIMSMICDLWPQGDVIGYLYQLLSDNRGGQRVGFALPVVEEILFLIELKDTSNRVE